MSDAPSTAVPPPGGYHQPPPETMGPTRPSRHERARTGLEAMEAVLLRILIGGVVVLLVTVAIAWFATRGHRAVTLPVPVAPGATAPTSSMTIRVVYPDGFEQRYTAVPVNAGDTLLQAMNAARAGPRGLRFTTTDTSRGPLVTSIGDLANEGGGGGTRNWQVWVNGTYGIGIGEQPVHPGDQVEWKYETFDQGFEPAKP